MQFLYALRKLIPYAILHRIFVRSLTKEDDATYEAKKDLVFKESDYRNWINQLALDLTNRLEHIKKG